MAHEMIGFYNVADSTDDVLKVMRSYQYYAAKAISVRVAGRKWRDEDKLGGHVWHTTGSGKTLTSFKSAHLIAESGDADKVVFLIDRVELGTQSLGEYRGFADDATTVQETENTGVLITKLKSSDPADTLIVTSIQKMSRIQEEGGYKAKDIELINRKRIVFIVDECHRDVFGEMMRKIKETFPLAMFFGFTGTPIQPENQKKMNTTTDVFGDELHRYSIADGNPTDKITYEELCQIFSDFGRYIWIPHYDKKPPIDSNILSAMKDYIDCGEVGSIRKFIYCQKNTGYLTPVYFSDIRPKEDLLSFPPRQT